MLRRLSRIFSIAAATASVLTACGDHDSGATARSRITVFAATSLTAAFSELAGDFEARERVEVDLNFAASTALIQQLREGAAADVVALADQVGMQALRERGLVSAPRVMARSRLVIATPRDNPARVTSLRDLARAEVVSLCGAEVPCGRYADRALRAAGVTLEASKVSRGRNSGATLAAVAEGDADAAIVYATDARAAGDRVATVRIPASHNAAVRYPLALTAKPRHATTAHAFVGFVFGPAGQRVLQAHGFVAA